MNLLEKYLFDEHPSDQQDAADIEKALTSAVRLFESDENFHNEFGWPYALPLDSSRPPESFSQNTTAMIVNVLLRFRGHFNQLVTTENSFRKNIFQVKDAEKKCKLKTLSKSLILLLNNIYHGTTFKTYSATYGDNDIFTLAWLTEIQCARWNPQADETHSILNDWRTTLHTDLKKAVGEKLTNWGGGSVGLFSPKDATPQEHSFPILRLVQAAKRLGIEHDFNDFHQYFERSLHEQLSFSSIPDSRFDPAELMFCFEGMLLCRPSDDRTIFDRVLEVLTVAQNKSAFWRPVKPFLATKQGLVLFPVSVEIANSLMRCCVMVDKDSLHDTYGSKCVKLLRRYWQWLRARAVNGPGDSTVAHLGWHSEHVNEISTIHLWETSQVMEFLMSYRNMLHIHIARTTLVLSRFKVDPVPVHEGWTELVRKFEPVSSLGLQLEVYKNIGRDFVNDRSQSDNNNYSMLLYGPPGTGKTTVAKSIAAALGYRMITVTVSDFLASGGAQVEARAKDVFTVLMAQPDCVVLFDEIDHFLLDRDSARYSKQDTLFQFMTPGMLTKIADLRECQRPLFIVATNYEDRIDPAIKRTGRIDRQYLLLPPDKKKRLELIEILLANFGFGDEKISSLDKATQDSLADSSMLLGFPDIKAAVQSFCKEENKDLEKLSRLLKERARTISLEAYQSRFKNEGTLLSIRETPMTEFLSLVALNSEAMEPDLVKSKAALNAAAEVIRATNSVAGESITDVDIVACDRMNMGAVNASRISVLFNK